jgi:hypothetical protein
LRRKNREVVHINHPAERNRAHQAETAFKKLSAGNGRGYAGLLLTNNKKTGLIRLGLSYMLYSKASNSIRYVINIEIIT